MSTSPDALDQLLASLPSSGAPPKPAPTAPPRRTKPYSIGELQDSLRTGGWPEDQIVKMSAIGWHEGAHGALKPNRVASGAQNPSGLPEDSVGPWQINWLAHKPWLSKQGIKKEDLYDPVVNARVAYQLYQKEGYKPWRLANERFHQQYVPMAQQAYNAKKSQQSGPDALDELLKSLPQQQGVVAPGSTTAPSVSPSGLQNQPAAPKAPEIPKEALTPPADQSPYSEASPEQVPVYQPPIDDKAYTGNVGRIMQSGPQAEAAYRQFLQRNVAHVKGKAASTDELLKNEALASTFVNLQDYFVNNPKAKPHEQARAIAQMGQDWLNDPNTKGQQMPTILHQAMLSAHWTPEEFQALPSALRSQIAQQKARAQASRRPRAPQRRYQVAPSETRTAESGGPDEPATPIETQSEFAARMRREPSGVGGLRMIDDPQTQFMKTVEDEKRRTVMPGDPGLFERLRGRGIKEEDAQAVVNLGAGPPKPSLMQSSEERAQTQAVRDEWERHQMSVKAMADSNALTDQLRDKASQRTTLQRVLRMLNPSTAADAISEEPKVHLFAGGAVKATGEISNTAADLLHFVDTAGNTIEGNSTITKLTDKMRDLGAYLEGTANIEPKTPGEAFAKSAGSMAGQAEKFALMKGASKLPFWAIMGGEAALRTQTQPIAVQAKETAWGIVQGVGIEYGPSVATKLLGKMPGAVGSFARQFPNLVGTGVTAGGFGGLAAEETYRKTGSKAEAAGAGLGAAAATAALSLSGGGAKELAEEARRAEMTPERVRDFLGGRDRALVIDHDGRALSLYGDPKTKGVGGEEITPERAEQYARRGAEEMPVRRVSPEEFEQIKDFVKSKPQKSGEKITKTITKETEAPDASTIRGNQGQSAEAAPGVQRPGTEVARGSDLRSEGQGREPVKSGEVASKGQEEAVQGQAPVARLNTEAARLDEEAQTLGYDSSKQLNMQNAVDASNDPGSVNPEVLAHLKARGKNWQMAVAFTDPSKAAKLNDELWEAWTRANKPADHPETGAIAPSPGNLERAEMVVKAMRARGDERADSVLKKIEDSTLNEHQTLEQARELDSEATQADVDEANANAKRYNESVRATLDRLKPEGESSKPSPLPTEREGASGVQSVPVSQLNLDPERFQYKIQRDTKGATGSLADVSEWNPNFAGVTAVWRDPANGRDYIVNGHNRFDLAKRTGQTNLDVRYIDAPDAESARAQGALMNIAEGQGTALDAGEFLRGHTPEDLKQQGLNLKRDIVAKGVALSKLSKFLFNQVVQGELPEEYAVQIGNKIESPDLQDQAFKAIKTAEAKGRTLNKGTVDEMIDSLTAAPRQTETEHTLFGDITSERSLVVERAQVAASLKRQLSADKSLFGTAARQSERLKEGGTVVDVEQAKKLQESAAEASGIFDTLKNRSGPISDILDEGARQVASGKRADQVAKENYEKIKEAVSGLLGRGKGGTGKADQKAIVGAEEPKGQRSLAEASGKEPAAAGDELDRLLADLAPDQKSAVASEKPNEKTVLAQKAQQKPKDQSGEVASASSKVLAHVAGPSGAGKTELVNKLGESVKNIDLVDLDIFDEQAVKALGLKDKPKNDYTDAELDRVHEKRQSLIDDYIEKSDKPIVFFGHHIEGENVTDLPTEDRYLLNVSPTKAALNASRRPGKTAAQVKEDIAIGKQDVSDLKKLDYEPLSSRAIYSKIKQLSEDVTHGRQNEAVQGKALPSAKGAESEKAAIVNEAKEAAGQSGVRQGSEAPERSGRSAERTFGPGAEEKPATERQAVQLVNTLKWNMGKAKELSVIDAQTVIDKGINFNDWVSAKVEARRNGYPVEQTSRVAIDRLSGKLSAIPMAGSSSDPYRKFGPGAAAKGDVPQEDPLSQFTAAAQAAIAEGNPKTPDDTFRLGEAAAEKWSKTKGSAMKGFAGLRSGVASAVHWWFHPVAPVGDEITARGLWDGNIQRARQNIRTQSKLLTKAVPNRLDRRAIGAYAGAIAAADKAKISPEEILTDWASKSTGYTRRVYARAAKLSDAHKTIAKNSLSMMEQMGDYALDPRKMMSQVEGTSGPRSKHDAPPPLLKQLLEDYFPRIVKDANKPEHALHIQGQLNEFALGKLPTSFKFARQRVFGSEFEGEQHGIVYGDKDFVGRQAAYLNAFYNTFYTRMYLKDLLNAKEADGRPTVTVSGGGTPIVENEPAYKAEVPDIFIVKAGKKPKVSMGTPMPGVEHVEPEKTSDYQFVAHPALKGWRWLGDIGGVPILYEGNLLVHPDKVQAFRSMLGKSWWQQHAATRWGLQALGTAKSIVVAGGLFHPVQTGLRGAVRGVVPVKDYNPFALETPDFKDPDTWLLARTGTLFADNHALARFAEGVGTSGIINKIPVIGTHILHPLSEWTFLEYIPAMKNTLGKKWLAANRKRYPNLSEDQVGQLTSRQVNATFGLQNVRYIARHPSTQDFLRTISFAPDWNESKLKSYGQALRPYGRNQMFGFLKMAFGMWILGRILNKLTDDDYHFDTPFTVVYNGREYGLKSDVTDFQMMVTNPRMWAMHRMNFFTSGAMEIATRTDDRGQRVDFTQAIGDIIKSVQPIALGRRRPGEQWWEGPLNSTGVTNYKHYTAAERILVDYLNDKPRVRSSPDERHQLIRELKDKSKKGSVESEISDALEKGKLTLADTRQIRDDEKMSDFALMMKHVPLEVALNAFEKADDKQKGDAKLEMALKLQGAKPEVFTDEMRARLEKDGFTIPKKIGSTRKVSETRRESQKERKETKAVKRWLAPADRPVIQKRRYQVTPR